jgi:hypothetical protein
MEYCIIGYLDEFVKPNPEGWGLDVTILSWLNTNKNMSHVEVWQAIQDDPQFDGTAPRNLEQDSIKKIMEWMFDHGMIGKPGNESITYTPPE